MINISTRRRKPTSEARTYQAKKWGKAHGFWGELGGWIYREGDKRTTKMRGGLVVQKPVCQGWASLYKWYGQEIERWHEKTRRGGDKKVTIDYEVT